MNWNHFNRNNAAKPTSILGIKTKSCCIREDISLETRNSKWWLECTDALFENKNKAENKTTCL